MSESRKRYLLAALLLAAVLAGVFFPYLFQGKTFLPVDEYNMLYKPFDSAHPHFNPYNHFEDDILKWFYEWKFYARKYLYRPYWSPNAFGGIPWYANTYASHFCSTNWILTLGPLEKTYPLQLIVQLWIAGFGMFLLLSSLRVRWGVAALYAIAFMLSSMFITLLMRWWIVGAFSWVPYLLWAARIFWESGRVRYFALSALFLALSFTDGFLQSDAFVLLLFGVYSLGSWYWERRQQNFFAFAAQFTGIIVFAFALSAVMWLPTMEYFLLDLAKGGSRASGVVFGKNIWQRLLSIPMLVSFMMPQILGSVNALDLSKLINTHLQDFSAFVGSLPLFFGICGFSRWRNGGNNIKPFLAIAALGVIIPVFTPFDRYFYFRFLIVYVTGMCVVGALAMESYLQEDFASRAALWLERMYFGVFGLIAAGAATATTVFQFWGEWFRLKLHTYIEQNINSSTVGSRNHAWMFDRINKTLSHFSIFSPSMFVPLMLAAAGLACLAAYRRRLLSKRGLIVGATIVTFFELCFFAHSWLPINDPREYPFFPKNYVAEFMKANGEGFRGFLYDDWTVTNRQREHISVPTNSQVMYGYHLLNGFDGLTPPVVFYIGGRLQQNDYRLLGLLNVKYVLSSTGAPLNDPALKLVKDGPVAIYENKLAKPRARIVFDYRVLAESEVSSRMLGGNYDGQSVLFSQEPSLSVHDGVPAQEDVQILSEEDNRIKYRIKPGRAGYFVASETYYPGWKARIDGQEAPVLRGNYAMRAVPVSAGEHELEFLFEPNTYRRGLLISALSVLLFALIFLAPGRALQPKMKSALPSR